MSKGWVHVACPLFYIWKGVLNMVNKYDKAALLIGKLGVEAEADAIVRYLEFISIMEESAPMSSTEIEVVKNIKERIGDELNHLLGDTLDAMRLADLKIADDDIEKIFEGLKQMVEGKASKSTYGASLYVTNPDATESWNVQAKIRPGQSDQMVNL